MERKNEHDEHDEKYEADCVECCAAVRQSALDAGIPASVYDGKTKLSDHFSQEYIDSMTSRNGDNQ